jgi:hypothetical protein
MFDKCGPTSSAIATAGAPANRIRQTAAHREAREWRSDRLGCIRDHGDVGIDRPCADLDRMNAVTIAEAGPRRRVDLF